MTSIFSSHLFAVNREDHLVESQVIEQLKPVRMLTIGSGGCVALTLKTIYPELHLSVFDINPHQLSHINNKIKALRNSDYDALNIFKKNDTCLNQSGKFDEMFQELRDSFINNISSENEISKFFDVNISLDKRRNIQNNWQNNTNIYKPFEDVFNDISIAKIFGDEATKHGKPGSYVNYMKKKILEGLSRKDSHLNPFLQHIFLGYYQSEFVFPYLSSSGNQDLELIEGDIFTVKKISSYDIVSLSNIFDWSETEYVKEHVEYLSQLNKGCAIILRQLNNHKDWIKIFSKYFVEDDSFDLHWQIHDRSLFYDHFKLFIRK
tara:strand:- start:651 stop:1610 length:960 start_codon:yes stop_codon:yes gene_type:complete